MNVGDLIKELQKYDPNLPVVIPVNSKGIPRTQIVHQVDSVSVVNGEPISGKFLVRDAYKESEKRLDEVELLMLRGF